jgi:hypothetical protein
VSHDESNIAWLIFCTIPIGQFVWKAGAILGWW